MRSTAHQPIHVARTGGGWQIVCALFVGEFGVPRRTYSCLQQPMSPLLVGCTYEDFYRQHKGLQSQDHGVDNADRVNTVQS